TMKVLETAQSIADGMKDAFISTEHLLIALTQVEDQAQRLLDFFIRHLGAPVYNQAIQDARGFLQDRLTDLEGEFYEPEASEGE
ncbi:MAG: DUF2164 family protein, partial [Myxococcota bacterium]